MEYSFYTIMQYKKKYVNKMLRLQQIGLFSCFTNIDKKVFNQKKVKKVKKIEKGEKVGKSGKGKREKGDALAS